MKWYIELPLFCVFVFIALYLTTSFEINIILVNSVVFSVLIYICFKLGFKSVKSKDIPQNNLEDYEKVPLVQNRIFSISTYRKKKR